MIAQCDSCGANVPAEQLKHCASTPPGVEGNLCSICRNTVAGNAFLYPLNKSYDGPTLKTIAYVANVLLTRLTTIESKLDELRNQIG